jgi:hypothetical protein
MRLLNFRSIINNFQIRRYMFDEIQYDELKISNVGYLDKILLENINYFLEGILYVNGIIETF